MLLLSEICVWYLSSSWAKGKYSFRLLLVFICCMFCNCCAFSIKMSQGSWEWTNLSLSPITLLPCFNQEIIGFERDQKAKLELQRKKVGGKIRSGDLQAARVSNVWKEVWVRRARRTFVARWESSCTVSIRSFPCGSFPAWSLHSCPLAEDLHVDRALSEA